MDLLEKKQVHFELEIWPKCLHWCFCKVSNRLLSISGSVSWFWPALHRHTLETFPSFKPIDKLRLCQEESMFYRKLLLPSEGDLRYYTNRSGKRCFLIKIILVFGSLVAKFLYLPLFKPSNICDQESLRTLFAACSVQEHLSISKILKFVNHLIPRPLNTKVAISF